MRKSPSLLDMRTTLRDFALINYAVAIEKVRPFVPDRFDIQTFKINNKEFAMLSIVPFVDTEFRFVRIAPFIKFECCQINHRLYVIDKKTNERVVWFFGHHLSSWLVQCVRVFWKLPWYAAKITHDCFYDRLSQRYLNYQYKIESNWSSGVINLTDSGQSVSTQAGFNDYYEMKAVLTHPERGFYRDLKGRVGTYAI